MAPLLAMAGLTLTVWALARPVEIAFGGRQLTVRSNAASVGQTLRLAGLALSPADSVAPAPSARTVSGQEIVVIPARPVSVEIDGRRQTVTTASRIPGNILADLGVELLPGDRLWVDGLPAASGLAPHRQPSRLRIERGADMRYQLAGRTMQVRSLASSLAELLSEAGRSLYEGDQVAPGWMIPLSPEADPAYAPSRPLAIEVDGQRLLVRSGAQRVHGALDQVGLALVGLDWVEPGMNERLPSGGVIRVHRVREEVLVELEPVPFETEFQPLAEVEIDSQRIIDTGAYGVQANQVRIRYQDGVEVQRRLEGHWLAREPQPRRVGYGTNIEVRSLATADGTIEYWRAVQMWATSYSPSRAGVSPDAPNFGITASGQTLRKGLVAIDRSLIAFGTRMYVPGYGFAEAADTGGGVRGRWIDLGYEDDEYIPWASYVTVYFLTPVPPANNIVWIFP
ncbi:MAG TPA: ubiquitin-like domain-containing protein [Anaerolineales bacterium]